MTGYIPGEQPRQGEFVKLNTNENPYPASPDVADAIREALDRGLVRYPDSMGQPFREAAAEVLGVPPEWILCGNGSDDILTIATRTFVGTGECLRLPYPSYILYRTLAQLQGAGSEEVKFRPDWSLGDDFAGPKDGLRLAFLPNPNSPSGTMIPPQRILEIARSLPCPLLVDEAYADFAETDCLHLVEQEEKILVSRTMSKSYALAGLRFGYLVAQPQMIEQLVKVKDSYNCDALAIAGAAAAIRDQAWRADNRLKILATRQRLADGMRRLGFVTVPSQANFTWNTHPEQPLQPLYLGLKQHGFLVRYMNYPGWSDGLRISVGTDEQIQTVLELLESMMNGRR
ncbi:MAG: pyridoxal phosphate-dependent aminotransferase [Thermoguttaceae bacterium]